AAAIELCEVGFGERAGELTGAVGAEIEMDDRVPVGDAVVVADDGRPDELVGLAPIAAGGDGGQRVGSVLAPGVDDRVVGELRPIPALIAVHRVVATADGADAAGVAQPALELAEVAGARVRRRVA